ncbi:MAG: hypothetical protein Q9224_007441 [Gallowayella concinna]
MLEAKPDAMLRDGDKSDLSSESSVSQMSPIDSDRAPVHDHPPSQLGEIGSARQLSSIWSSTTGGSGSASNEKNPDIHYPRQGSTTLSMEMVNIEALNELGYPFTYEENNVVVSEALGEKQIQEIIHLSKERSPKFESEAHETLEKETECSAERLSRDLSDTVTVEGYGDEVKDHTELCKPNESIRPRDTRVAKKHVDLDTLDAYGLPWKQDEVSQSSDHLPCKA